MCEELQQSVSSLDGRLAELIHWEAEVREFYALLKEKSHRHQKEQDFRTRVLLCHTFCVLFFALTRDHGCLIWKLSE